MSNNLLPRFSPRLWLWVALAALLLVNYQTWLHDYGPPPQATAPPAANAAPNTVTPASDLGDRLPKAPRTATPAPGERAHGEAGTPAASGAPGTAPGAAAAAPRVRVRTDVLDLDISTRGGTLTRVDLPAYPQVKGEATRVRLENEDGPLSRYELQSGLTDSGAAAYPTHLATFASAPPRGAPWRFTLGVSGNEYLLSATGPEQSVAPGATAQFGASLYVGPKLQRQLETTAPSSAGWRITAGCGSCRCRCSGCSTR